MSVQKLFFTVLVSASLTACFGDNNESTTPTQPDSVSIADSAYTGVRTAAAISEAKASGFPKSAFAARDFMLIGGSFFALLPDSAAKPEQLGARVADMTLSRLVSTQARTVDGSGTCSNNGQVSVTADVDDNAHTGKLLTNFTNCLVDGTILDGTTETDVAGYDVGHGEPTAMSVTFKGLSLTADSKTVALTGTQKATQDIVVGTANLSAEIHLKSGAGDEALAKMDTVLTSKDNGSVSSTLDGSVCLGTEGCVSMQTVKAFTVDPNGDLVEGELLLEGAKGSKAQVLVLKPGLVQINVDEDGDGSYEKHLLLD